MPRNDFNAQNAIQEVQTANEGIKFDTKIQESIARSTPVQTEIKTVVWALMKEKIIWLVAGAFSFILFELIKELGFKLIDKIK